MSAEQVLLAAMRLGETCIVTNADENQPQRSVGDAQDLESLGAGGFGRAVRMWVTESARRYMPRVLPILPKS